MTPFEQKLYALIVETLGQPWSYRHLKTIPVTLAKLTQSLSIVMIAYALAAKQGNQVKSAALISTNRNTVRKYMRHHEARMASR